MSFGIARFDLVRIRAAVLLLAIGEFDRRFDDHVHHQVARRMAAHVADALAAQAEDLGALGFGGMRMLAAPSRSGSRFRRRGPRW